MSSDPKQKFRVHFRSSYSTESWLVYSAVLLYLIKVSALICFDISGSARTFAWHSYRQCKAFVLKKENLYALSCVQSFIVNITTEIRYHSATNVYFSTHLFPIYPPQVYIVVLEQGCLNFREHLSIDQRVLPKPLKVNL